MLGLKLNPLSPAKGCILFAPAKSQRSREDRRLLIEIWTIHRQSRRTYGSPRIYRELRERHYRCGRHRVSRLMRRDGLHGSYRRRFRVTTLSEHRWPVAANRLERRFEVSRPDTVWAGDISVPQKAA